jgi:hypothetical protein
MELLLAWDHATHATTVNRQDCVDALPVSSVIRTPSLPREYQGLGDVPSFLRLAPMNWLHWCCSFCQTARCALWPVSSSNVHVAESFRCILLHSFDRLEQQSKRLSPSRDLAHVQSTEGCKRYLWLQSGRLNLSEVVGSLGEVSKYNSTCAGRLVEGRK